MSSKTRQEFRDSFSGPNNNYAELLQLFAELFKFPERNFYESIKSGGFDKEVKRLSHLAGKPLNTDFHAIAKGFNNFLEDYNNCFLGKKQPFAPPVESVYKVWTRDQSYRLPHKNQTGYLMGDSALHIKYLLETLALEIPKEYEGMPDHLTILLEIYAFLNQEGMGQEADDFLGDHFDWLPALSEALAKVENSDFYLYAVLQLQQLLGISPPININ
ncbi:MAG: molecular chaperone TorD family protein [Bacillota bacterium]